MTSDVFRVWLLPNPPLEFTPDEEVWRDITIDESHTLADLHEAIFDAFERWDTHGYEFLTRDSEGIALRSYPHPQLYNGGPSWPPMDDEELDRVIDQAVFDELSEDGKQRFRELQSNPPTEGKVADTTIGDLDSDGVDVLSYTFDMGDSWEHYIERQETREKSLDGDPTVVDEQGGAPPQYPEYDE